jgi:hydroxymethylpyrimidine/phosphomethylpyrimidine kinase
MPRLMPHIPVALTIAGSDSSGGAGVQADLKSFAAIGVHGTSVITCVTAQNPAKLARIEPVTPRMVQKQIEMLWTELPPGASKTGMLYEAATIHTVARWFRKHRKTPLIVDPVMVATSGAVLLKRDALIALRDELLPLATLATPNLDEASLLFGRRLGTVEDLRRAARVLHERFGCAMLMKGGHLRGLKQAVDVFFDGREELLLTAPFVRGIRTHGTGCTYSAAIAGYCALGFSLARAVCKAKEFITRAIAESAIAGRNHCVLRQPFQKRLMT